MLTFAPQIYRYEPGQSFAPHYDDTVKVGSYHTEWTLLIYLSGEKDGVEGGETVFYPCGIPPVLDGKRKQRQPRQGYEDVVITPKKGLAILHKHGRDCLLHEGKPVKNGIKWVLRSDLVMG